MLEVERTKEGTLHEPLQETFWKACEVLSLDESKKRLQEEMFATERTQTAKMSASLEKTLLGPQDLPDLAPQKDFLQERMFQIPWLGTTILFEAMD